MPTRSGSFLNAAALRCSHRCPSPQSARPLLPVLLGYQPRIQFRGSTRIYSQSSTLGSVLLVRSSLHSRIELRSSCRRKALARKNLKSKKNPTPFQKSRLYKNTKVLDSGSEIFFPRSCIICIVCSFSFLFSPRPSRLAGRLARKFRFILFRYQIRTEAKKKLLCLN